MEKIKVNQVVVVEGKYDAIKLDSIIEGLIIPVNGFSIFKDEEKKLILKQLGTKNGIILVTDSDTAGFKIRNYLRNICKKANIIDVYIPNIEGKEPRKAEQSKEGFLGVEGVSKEILLKCFRDAGISATPETVAKKGNLTYTDLYLLKLSGTDNSSKNRQKLCEVMGIPYKLSKKSFLEVLNRMTDKENIQAILKDEKPTLFWDFHGTLTLHLHQWTDCAYELINTNFPQLGITHETVCENLDGKCLPWYTYPNRDTRHLLPNDGWWTSCNNELFKMFVACGLSEQQAELVYTKVRPYLVDVKNNPLYDDTKAVLGELKNRGYKNYLVSNNYPELDEVMDKLELTNYFEDMVISGKIGYDKPRKEIFEIAKNVANNPKECIMIGDNINDDIHGAKACGFKTIWIAKKGKEDKDADYVCEELSEILDILKG
ncbi:MAG: HAD-IA family hydrolase [Oscillospiraceae bacterium]